jgi:hypothetical protein
MHRKWRKFICDITSNKRFIKLRGPVVGTSDLYSESPGFKHETEDSLYWGLSWLPSLPLGKYEYNNLN